MIPVLLLAAAYALLAVIVPALGQDIIKYWLFQVIFILLPGFLFTTYLMKNMLLTASERFFFGYPLGCAFVFLASVAAKSTHPALLYVLIFPAAVLAIFRLVRMLLGNTRPEPPDYRTAGVFFMLFTVACGLLFVLFTGNINVPEPGRAGVYHSDTLWNLGTTWSYVRGFPLIDARCAGIPLRYHMFQNIIHANIHETTGIDPFNTLCYLDPPLVMFMIVFAIVFGGRRILKLNPWETLLLGTLLLFTSEFIPIFNKLQAQFYVNPLSLYYGMPAFLLLLFFITASFNNDNFHHPLLTGSLFLIVATTKTHLMVILPAAYFSALAGRWLTAGKRTSPAGVVSLLLMVAIALLLKLYFYHDGAGRVAVLAGPGGEGALFPRQALAVIGETLAAPWGPLKEIGFLFIRRLSMFIRQPFIIAYLLTLTFSGEFRRQFVFPRRYYHLLVWTTVTFSLLLSSAVNFGGNTAYFFWYARITALLYAVDLLRFLLQKRHWFSISVATILLLAGVVPAVSFIQHRVMFMKQVVHRSDWDARDSLDYGEYEAMRWIRQNTQPDMVFITDRRMMRVYPTAYELPLFYHYSAFSGRQFWVEGDNWLFGRNLLVAQQRWKLVGSFLYPADIARQQLALRQIPADYFIHSRRFNRNDYSTVPNLEKVFANDSIVIYRISAQPV